MRNILCRINYVLNTQWSETRVNIIPWAQLTLEGAYNFHHLHPPIRRHSVPQHSIMRIANTPRHAITSILPIHHRSSSPIFNRDVEDVGLLL